MPPHRRASVCIHMDRKLGRAWLVVSRVLRWVEWGGPSSAEKWGSEYFRICPIFDVIPPHVEATLCSLRVGTCSLGWWLILYTWDSRNLSVRDTMGLQMAKKKHPRLWAGSHPWPSLEASGQQPALPVSYCPVLFSSTSWSTWWLPHITMRFWSLRVGKIAALSSKLHKANKEL